MCQDHAADVLLSEEVCAQLRVEQALSLVLTSQISFGSDVLALGTPALLGIAAQRQELCGAWKKGGAPWSVCLGAGPKLSLCPQDLPKP